MSPDPRPVCRFSRSIVRWDDPRQCKLDSTCGRASYAGQHGRIRCLEDQDGHVDLLFDNGPFLLP